MNKIDEIALRVADKHDPRGNYFPYRNDLLLYVKELLAELSNEEKPEGYALVPTKPNQAILDLMYSNGMDMHDGDLTNVWTAILLAAARSGE